MERSRVAELHTRAERLAFWINVYNIFTIDTLVANEPGMDPTFGEIGHHRRAEELRRARLDSECGVWRW